MEFGDEMLVDKKKCSIEEGTAMLMEKAATQLLNVELCLDMTNLEIGLFPEERNWLTRNNIVFTLEAETDEALDDLSEEEIEKAKRVEEKKEEQALEKFNREPNKGRFKEQAKELKRESQTFKENFSSEDSEDEVDEEEDLPE